jgi:hypothetical protein
MEHFMTAQRSLAATSVVAILAGLFATTTAAQSPHGDTKPPSIRLAMHDDMMNMPGMKGGGMGGQMPAAKPPGPATHSPAPSTPGAHAPADANPPAHGPAPSASDPRGHGPMGMMGTMIDLPTDRIEGRIAFLHAELRITEAQMTVWTELATVMRANAKRMSEAQGQHQQTAAPSAIALLDSHERWLVARLESVRALKAAYAKLYAALDESQRKVGDQLVVHQMGIR